MPLITILKITVAMLISTSTICFANTTEKQKETQVEHEPHYHIEVPVLINKVYTGDIGASMTLSGKVKIPKRRLRDLLLQKLSEAQINTLIQARDPEFIYLTEIQQRGITIEFDSATLTINVKARRQGAQNITLKPSRNPPKTHDNKQAQYAAGLSIYLQPQYIHRSPSGEEGFSPLQANSHGFISLGGFQGWSLAFALRFQEHHRKAWQREDITLFHDDFKNALRYSIGDIRPRISRFQSQVQMLGFSVERDYAAIQPFRNLRPNGRSQFSLDRDSLVSFEVNGVVISQQNLDQGDYNIEDFPFTAGSNDVKIIVEDINGRRDISSFSSYVDNALLSRGYSNFGFSLGHLKKRGSKQTIRYHNTISLLGFWEKGLSDALTLGTNIEFNENQNTLATSVIWGSPIGVFASELASTQSRRQKRAYTGTVSYAWRPSQQTYSQGWALEFDSQLQLRGKNYKSLADELRLGKQQDFSSRLALRRGDVSLNLAGSWRKDNRQKSSSLSLLGSKRLNNFNISLGYQIRETNSGRQNSLIASISRRFGSGTARWRHSSNPEKNSVEWHRPSPRHVGNSASRLSASSTATNINFDSSYSYIANRAEFDVRHRTSKNRNFINSSLSSTRVNMAMGFGYADKNFAFGRPFRESFVVLNAHPNLDKAKIDIRRSSLFGPNLGHTGSSGTALIPLSGSYREQRIVIDIEQLPLGYDIGEGQLKAFPGRYGAFSYTAGSTAANTVIGRLVKVNRQAISLKSGVLRPIHQVGKDIDFFTNRNGRFVAEKVPPGQYSILLKPTLNEVGKINVPEGTPGLIELGEIHSGEKT